ncbi:MAG: glycosyltransferase family 9 protein [Micromonosporaceae bacterium]
MILVLRTLGIGDLCTAVPALRALRAAHPGEEIVLAAPEWLAPLVSLIGVADRQVVVDDLKPVSWPGPAPTVAVNLHGRGPESHRLLAAAGPGRLWAFACPEADHHDGPPWTEWEPEHEVRRWCRLLAWYGVPAEPANLDLPREPVRRLARAHDVPTGVTIVHPGVKGFERRWPARRFAEVAAVLAADGHRVVLTGSESERTLVEAVARDAGLPDAAILAGEFDVGQLAALVAHARLVVSSDTGVGHLATGYGVPSVVIFGPTTPEVWGPPPDRPRHRALRHPDGLGAVSVPEVLAAARGVLAAPRSRTATAL